MCTRSRAVSRSSSEPARTRDDKARLTRLALFFCAICGTAGALLAGCASPRETAAGLARGAGLEPRRFATPGFVLAGYARRSDDRNALLAVYVEGDGAAFLDSTHVSSDPTPTRPVGLELAALGPSRDILYLARPCQYVAAADRRNCQPIYWTTHRYAREVIASMNAAIDQELAARPAKGITLTGYSGGGPTAALIAAMRGDVVRLVTIAGNLDHAYWAKRDRLTPLSGSLNPIDFVAQLASVPQVHFAGADDDVVTPDVIESYRARFPASSDVRVIVVPGFDHRCCWVKEWPRLMQSIAR